MISNSDFYYGSQTNVHIHILHKFVVVGSQIKVTFLTLSKKGLIPINIIKEKTQIRSTSHID